MTETSSGWLEADDGLAIFRREWRGTSSAHATLLSIHGLASHSGWVDSLATRLAARGIVVHACDLRGHGRTGPVPGQLPAPTRLLEDLDLAFDATGEGRPVIPGAADRSAVQEGVARLPKFILGTSLGGCLAISLAARNPDDVAGLILISPALSPIYMSTIESVGILLDLLVGGRRRIATPRSRGLMICKSKEVRDRLEEDRLSLSALPSRAHWSAFRIIQRAKHDLARVNVPVLCLQGANDPVVSAEFNRRRFGGRPNTTFVCVEEAYHDLALEPDLGKIDARIGDWIEQIRG